MILLITHLFLLLTTHSTDTNDPLLEDVFPHFQFDCDPQGHSYETEFSFLQGLGHGFVHAEPHRIFFEYYFPAQHWVAFSTADQVILNQADQCSLCYFTNYYPLSPTNKNHSNLYPNCIEECLDDVIFVATVNSDEENIENWSIIEFQIAAQQSKSLQKKMYRIPTQKDLLEIWGEEDYPYREYSHFEAEIIPISVSGEEKDFVHARFWRLYDYGDNTENEWKPFVVGPYDNSHELAHSDTFCFLSVGSFYGGEYPYDDDALRGKLPGFYIDTQHLANIHCYKRDDIKVDCGQDWSFLSETGDNVHTDIELDTNSSVPADNDVIISNSDTEITTTTTSTSISRGKKAGISSSTTTSTTSSTAVSTSTLQPKHDEDCCSVVSKTSYDDINCLDISQSVDYISVLEGQWKENECGRSEKLPVDLDIALTTMESNICNHLWALLNQIHEICNKYSFTSKKMKVFNIFKRRGAFECFDVNTDECIKQELKFDTTNVLQGGIDGKKESELAEMEEDGGLTMTTLGILGLIISALSLYILYWFCCSNSSKGYRQSSQYMNHGYYDDDIDTDDYEKRHKLQQRKYYNQRINGDFQTKYDESNSNSGDSDWSEDEQLNVIQDNHNNMEIDNKKKKKIKKKKKKKSKHNDEYENDSNEQSYSNDAVEINVNDKDENDDDDDDDEEYNETIQYEED